MLRYSCAKYDIDVKELLVQLLSHLTQAIDRARDVRVAETVGASGATATSGAAEAKAGSEWADALLLCARMPPLGIRPSQDPEGLRSRRATPSYLN